MNSKKLGKLVFTGLFAAMICVTTAFILHIPAANGYIHIGDSIIYIAACILPLPYGVAAAGIGGAMADLISGYPIYIIPTLVIKSLNALCFYVLGKHEKMLCFKTVTASDVSCIVTVVGYYAAAVILYGNPAAQFFNTVPANIIQGAASGALFCAAAFMLDKTPIRLGFK